MTRASTQWTVNEEDHFFSRPFVDIDEPRSTPHPHRYIHGGFTGTDTRFSFYFPPASSYEGRFFQHFTPVPQDENLAQSGRGQDDKIGFAFESGGYFVETNGGATSGSPTGGVDATIAGFRANAAAARFSRMIAESEYGDHRPFGYAFGGSGGAYRTLGAAEMTQGVWDGFVPYVVGSPVAVPSVFAVRMQAQRILRDKLDAVADAYEVGGSGDPSDVLSEDEAAALREVTRMGFPVRSWFGHKTMGTQAFGVLYPEIVKVDPDYFVKFWTDPGYLGSDPASSVHRDRVRFEATVTHLIRRGDGVDLGPFTERLDASRGGVDEAFKGSDVVDQAVVGLAAEQLAPGWLQGAELVVLSGAAAGTRVTTKGAHGPVIVIDFPDAESNLVLVRPGDRVAVDNSNFLAAQTYHRHQVPGPEYAVWDQFRGEGGVPLFPQRPMQLGPMFAGAAAGVIPSGDFSGKMIMVESLLDREAFPWQADWYRARAEEHKGPSLNDSFRLWFTDNALHADDEWQEDPTRTVSYLGVLQEALREVASWVELGVDPALSTSYSIVDGQVEVPPTAATRHGVQPVVKLTARGSQRVDARIGEHVIVELSADVPTGAGSIIAVDWDLDGDRSWDEHMSIDMESAVEIARSVHFDGPGIHFVAARVTSHHDGDGLTKFARIENVARVRFVVT